MAIVTNKRKKNPPKNTRGYQSGTTCRPINGALMKRMQRRDFPSVSSAWPGKNISDSTKAKAAKPAILRRVFRLTSSQFSGTNIAMFHPLGHITVDTSRYQSLGLEQLKEQSCRLLTATTLVKPTFVQFRDERR